MLFWRYSKDRIFFLNEYWILVPIVIAVDYVVIRKIKNHKLKIIAREKLELAQKLQKKRRRDEVTRRIIALGLGLTASSYAIMCRGGIDENGNILKYIDVDHLYDPELKIPNGISYLDHERVREAIYTLFKRKARNGVIYITSTALCQIARKVGTSEGIGFITSIIEKTPVNLALYSVGVTDGYQLVRKVLVAASTAVSVILFYAGAPVGIAEMTSIEIICKIIPLLGGSNRAYYTLAWALAGAALKLGLYELDKIPTSLYSEGFLFKERAKSRIPGITDVVIINNNPRLITDVVQYPQPEQREKIHMPGFNERTTECWLPEQSFFNEKCQIKDISLTDKMHDLNIDEVVSMKDLKNAEYGVIDVPYTDVCDLGPVDPDICKPQIRKKKGKMVSFLEKFADPKEITAGESWETEQTPVAVYKEQIKTE